MIHAQYPEVHSPEKMKFLFITVIHLCHTILDTVRIRNEFVKYLNGYNLNTKQIAFDFECSQNQNHLRTRLV